MSSKGIPKKFEEIRSDIEKAVTPHIIVKISMPDEVNKEEFFKLENDVEFLQALKDFAKKWLKQKKKIQRKTKTNV